MVVTSNEKIASIVDNKYKAIVIVAKEARRLNKVLKENPEAIKEKPVIYAIKELLQGRLKYQEEE